MTLPTDPAHSWVDPSAQDLVDALVAGEIGFTIGCRLWLCWRLLVAPKMACATMICLTAQGIEAGTGETRTRLDATRESPVAKPCAKPL